jgi:hypothetical protein
MDGRHWTAYTVIVLSDIVSLFGDTIYAERSGPPSRIKPI